MLRLIAASTALALAGCGSDGGSGGSANSSSSSGTSSAAGTVSLSAASYSVPQNAGAVSISVSRSGGAQGSASVTYATQFGTALDGINYGNTNGVLQWASGDSSPKSFSVPILGATAFSGTKSLSVVLSQPTGAALGPLTKAAIMIMGVVGSPVAANARSISQWASCDGVTDDAVQVAAAFAAARNGAFPLLIDCPVLIHMGSDIGRTIFIDNGTTVQFSSAGRFILDNSLMPAFVIADSSQITLEGWTIEYRGGIPVNPRAPAYLNGQLISHGEVMPGNAFNDIVLTNWLAANRGIRFEDDVKSNWSGSTNNCALILITGNSSQVSVNNMQVSVPANAGGESFVPVVFALSQNFKPNQVVGAATPMTSAYVALPDTLTFSNIALDGTYMGWVGAARNVTFTHILSQRYGDLQDASGGNVGGVDKWFAPPHLFYLSYTASTDPLLVNSSISISNVSDLGMRVGVARDKGGTDSISGYALSLKIACNACSVDSYSSARPDGMLDVLASDGLSISRMSGTYDSRFLNNLYPGWRFPSEPYRNLSFTNVSIVDTAEESVQAPIGSAGMASNQGIVFSAVSATVGYWAGPGGLPLPSIAGSGKQISLSLLDNRRSLRVARAETDSLQATLQATPATLSAGGNAQLTWSAQGASECAASGAWVGTLSAAGARSVTLSAAGSYDFDMTCSNAQGASSPAVALVSAQ